MLKESNVTRNSSWSDIKHSCDHDLRYKAVHSSSRREDWFREYQSKHLDETNPAPAEVSRTEEQNSSNMFDFRQPKKTSNDNVKKKNKNVSMPV